MKESELRLELMKKRMEFRMTQSDLAKALGVSQKSVSMWENGETVPRDAMKVRLAHVFDLPTEYFLSAENGSYEDEKLSGGGTINKSMKASDADEKNTEMEQTVKMLLERFGEDDINLIIDKLKNK